MYGVDLLPWDDLPRAEAIVAAVAHKKFMTLAANELTNKVTGNGVFVDVKAAFPLEALRQSGARVWRL